VITPLPAQGEAGLPFAFDIAMAVRPADSTLRAALDGVLRRRRREVRRILDAYGIPRVQQ
jgi:hypothetical protein